MSVIVAEVSPAASFVVSGRIQPAGTFAVSSTTASGTRPRSRKPPSIADSSVLPPPETVTPATPLPSVPTTRPRTSRPASRRTSISASPSRRTSSGAGSSAGRRRLAPRGRSDRRASARANSRRRIPPTTSSPPPSGLKPRPPVGRAARRDRHRAQRDGLSRRGPRCAPPLGSSGGVATTIFTPSAGARRLWLRAAWSAASTYRTPSSRPLHRLDRHGALGHRRDHERPVGLRDRVARPIPLAVLAAFSWIPPTGAPSPSTVVPDTARCARARTA